MLTSRPKGGVLTSALTLRQTLFECRPDTFELLLHPRDPLRRGTEFLRAPDLLQLCKKRLHPQSSHVRRAPFERVRDPLHRVRFSGFSCLPQVSKLERYVG